jgi:hypothetical protein
LTTSFRYWYLVVEIFIGEEVKTSLRGCENSNLTDYSIRRENEGCSTHGEIRPPTFTHHRFPPHLSLQPRTGRLQVVATFLVKSDSIRAGSFEPDIDDGII